MQKTFHINYLIHRPGLVHNSSDAVFSFNYIRLKFIDPELGYWELSFSLDIITVPHGRLMLYFNMQLLLIEIPLDRHHRSFYLRNCWIIYSVSFTPFLYESM